MKVATANGTKNGRKKGAGHEGKKPKAAKATNGSEAPDPEIDQRIKKLLVPLTHDELAELERSMLAYGGARDRLVVWKGKNVLLDGHNRLPICKKHGLRYKTVEIALADMDAALDWV